MGSAARKKSTISANNPIDLSLYPVQEAYADQPCLFIHQEVLGHEKANNYIYDGLEMGVAISGQGTLLYQDTTIRLVPGDAYFL